jgi:hypothetical protein
MTREGTTKEGLRQPEIGICVGRFRAWIIRTERGATHRSRIPMTGCNLLT